MSSKKPLNRDNFSIKFLTKTQKEAWDKFQKSSVLFLLGPAGVGKSFLATALAINELFAERIEKIVLTRPIIEAEESLGFLPGAISEKTDPYMLPLFDQINKLVIGPKSEFNKSVEVAPLAYMRGRTFTKSVCILDEAQNCNYKQFKLFLTRLDADSKMIISGDPTQKDIRDSGLNEVVDRLSDIKEISVIRFQPEDIVRHPLVEKIIDRLK